MTFGHLSYVASYKHPAARKSAAGAAISWRVRPSVIGVEYALIVVCRGHRLLNAPAPHKRRSEPGRTRLVRKCENLFALDGV
jgi:hypothetical protein